MARNSSAGRTTVAAQASKGNKSKTAPRAAAQRPGPDYRGGAKGIPLSLATVSSAPRPAESPSIEEAIGAQVRALRKRHDMTVAELASQAGLSAGMLSKVENGGISPSLATLLSLAQALNVPITTLFTDFEQRHDITCVRAGEGLTIERRGTKSGHQYQLLGHPFAGDFACEPYLITMTEEAEPYTSFRHAGMEFIYILEGEVGYRHGNEVYRLAPGDSLFFNANTAHGPEELRRLPLKFLSVIVYQHEN